MVAGFIHGISYEMKKGKGASAFSAASDVFTFYEIRCLLRVKVCIAGDGGGGANSSFDRWTFANCRNIFLGIFTLQSMLLQSTIFRTKHLMGTF